MALLSTCTTVSLAEMSLPERSPPALRRSTTLTVLVLANLAVVGVAGAGTDGAAGAGAGATYTLLGLAA